MGVLSARQTRATVPLSNLPERTDWVDSSVCSLSLSDHNNGNVFDSQFVYVRAGRDSTGQYWIEGQIAMHGTGTTDSDFKVALSGITFAGSTEVENQSVVIGRLGDPASNLDTLTDAIALFGTNQINIRANAGIGPDFHAALPKLKLSGKPTWFDANREAGFSITAQVEPFDGASSGLMIAPTGLSDSAATMYGLKSYYHGTNYNGGNAPTVSFTSGTVDNAQMIPSMDNDGNWWLYFNLSVASLTAADYFTWSINDVTGAPLPMDWQSYYGGTLSENTTETRWARLSAGSSTFEIKLSTSLSTTIIAHGKVRIAAKPNWAY